MQYLILMLSFIMSMIINTLILDALMDIFKLMMDVVYLLNRITLTFFLYYLIKYFYDKYRNKKIDKEYLVKNLAIIYFVWLIGLLFGRTTSLPQYNLMSHFNFSSYLPYWFHHLDNYLVLLYIISNIVVFIPFGLLLRYYFRFLTSFLICIGLILFFETMQGVTNLGYFDIDDIILNSIGGLLGIIIMTIKATYFKRKYVLMGK